MAPSTVALALTRTLPLLNGTNWLCGVNFDLLWFAVCVLYSLNTLASLNPALDRAPDLSNPATLVPDAGVAMRSPPLAV